MAGRAVPIYEGDRRVDVSACAERRQRLLLLLRRDGVRHNRVAARHRDPARDLLRPGCKGQSGRGLFQRPLHPEQRVRGLADSRGPLLGRQHPDLHGSAAHGPRVLDGLVSRASGAELDRRRDHAAAHPGLRPDRIPAPVGHQGVLRHRGNHQDRGLTSAARAGRFHQADPSGRAGGWSTDFTDLLHRARIPVPRLDHPVDVHALPVHPRARHRGADVSNDDIRKEGPGAAVAEPKEVQIVELDGHGGHTLEPEWKRLPIGPDSILYPVIVGIALFPILMGDAGHHLADDMPDEDTHPFFPDHFWPYPVIIIVMMITIGLLAAFVQKNLQLEASADPRAVTIPRPDWYFLFLFQFIKLGPELLMSIVIPTVVIIVFLVWPFIDAIAGPRMAKRLGWKRWPVPGRNVMSGTGFVVFLLIIAGLEVWALAGPSFCLPWFTGPVCGA